MPGGVMVGVLVVAGDEVARAGFGALLAGVDGVDVVGLVGTGREAVARARDADVVLLDGDLPDVPAEVVVTGLAGAARPTGTGPRVLALCAGSDEFARRVVLAGAAAVLPREGPAAVLVRAVSWVAEGALLLGEDFARRLVAAYPGAPDRDLGARLDRLTARETDILRLVARGLRNAEIAERLVIGESTVKTHLNRAMAKLDVGSRAQAVVVAYETGLVVPGARPDRSTTRPDRSTPRPGRSTPRPDRSAVRPS